MLVRLPKWRAFEHKSWRYTMGLILIQLCKMGRLQFNVKPIQKAVKIQWDISRLALRLHPFEGVQ